MTEDRFLKEPQGPLFYEENMRYLIKYCFYKTIGELKKQDDAFKDIDSQEFFDSIKHDKNVENHILNIFLSNSYKSIVKDIQSIVQTAIMTRAFSYFKKKAGENEKSSK